MSHAQVVHISGAPRSAGRSRRGKRELILDAAIRVFARTGYHASRISDIAREAGIAYGLVYHYFRNKEEILNAIFAERWGGFLEALERIVEGSACAADKLGSIAALILNAYRTRPEWVKVLVLEIQRSSRFAEPSQLRAVGKFFQIVARVLREGQRAGELRRDLDPELACYVFIGGLELMITSLVLDRIDFDGQAFEERAYSARVARTVVDVFLNGVSEPGARR